MWPQKNKILNIFKQHFQIIPASEYIHTFIELVKCYQKQGKKLQKKKKLKKYLKKLWFFQSLSENQHDTNVTTKSTKKQMNETEFNELLESKEENCINQMKLKVSNYIII